MHRLFGRFEPGGGHYDLSFHATDRWALPEQLNASGRKAGTPVAFTAALLGDDSCGPVVLMIALEPGVTPPDAPAHTHASDNWRVSLKGSLPIGRDSYGPRQFRFQKGWKPYARDNYAHGPDGGWMLLIFGDRRGMRLRPVDRSIESPDATDRMLAEFLGIDGDLTTADDRASSGPSAMATNLGDPRGSHLNGSFDESDQWPEVVAGTRAVVGVLGEPSHGPLLVLTASAPGAPIPAPSPAGSETLRLVVAGSCRWDGADYVSGDLRLDDGTAPPPEGAAGPDGCKVAVLVGDRQPYLASADRSDPFCDAVREQIASVTTSTS